MKKRNILACRLEAFTRVDPEKKNTIGKYKICYKFYLDRYSNTESIKPIKVR